MTVHRSSGTRKPWIVYYILLGLAVFGAFTSGLNNGLSLDVKYSTYLGKAGIDYLNLQYLGGAVIWIAFALTALFMLSDPRISYGAGEDGKKAPLHAQQTLGSLTIIPDRQSRRSLSTQGDTVTIQSPESQYSGTLEKISIMPCSQRMAS